MSADGIEPDTEELPLPITSTAGRAVPGGDMIVGRAAPVVLSETGRQRSPDVDDPSVISNRFLGPRDSSSQGGAFPAILDDVRRGPQPVRSAIAEYVAILVVVLVAMLVAAFVISFAAR